MESSSPQNPCDDSKVSLFCNAGKDLSKEGDGSKTDLVSSDDPAAETGFRGIGDNSDADSFEYHYSKHGNGVNREQYARDAQDFAKNPTGIRTDVRLRDGSPGIKYRTPGGPGGIFDPDGNVISFWYK